MLYIALLPPKHLGTHACARIIAIPRIKGRFSDERGEGVSFESFLRAHGIVHFFSSFFFLPSDVRKLFVGRCSQLT